MASIPRTAYKAESRNVARRVMLSHVLAAEHCFIPWAIAGRFRSLACLNPQERIARQDVVKVVIRSILNIYSADSDICISRMTAEKGIASGHTRLGLGQI